MDACCAELNLSARRVNLCALVRRYCRQLCLPVRLAHVASRLFRFSSSADDRQPDLRPVSTSASASTSASTPPSLYEADVDADADAAHGHREDACSVWQACTGFTCERHGRHVLAWAAHERTAAALLLLLLVLIRAVTTSTRNVYLCGCKTKFTFIYLIIHSLTSYSNVIVEYSTCTLRRTHTVHYDVHSVWILFHKYSYDR